MKADLRIKEITRKEQKLDETASFPFISFQTASFHFISFQTTSFHFKLFYIRQKKQLDTDVLAKGCNTSSIYKFCCSFSILTNDEQEFLENDKILQHSVFSRRI